VFVNKNAQRDALLGAIVVFGLAGSASAETIEGALAKAYQNNPQINAQRAAVRATDESVPQALSGYRPTVGITSTIGEQFASSPGPNNTGSVTPRTVGVTANQTIFNGFQTGNRTRQAEQQVLSAREGLRVLVQTVLLNAATSYMDVLRDTANLEVQRSNVRVLAETLSQTRERFRVGEVTRTDVSQADAQLAAGQSSVLTAQSALAISRANYRQAIGVEAVNLVPGAPVDRFSPRTLPTAIAQAAVENPNVTAATYGIDIAFLQVKINEGALYPVFAVQASVQQSAMPQLGTASQFNASVNGTLMVPIYQGGQEYSLIRQSKETLSQQRISLDQVKDQTRQQTIQAWAQMEAAKAQVQSAQSQVAASEAALNGVRGEARIGERTTLDVLNAQQALVNARVALITAQHDRVVASYAVLAATGRLAPQVLRLPTEVYDPGVHYHQVRDAWIGMHTPDGR
jgi:outer membrane protein